MSTYRLIYILTTPIIATITLVIGYEYGHHLAALHGRTYRGGIGFGFSLWVSYAIFFIALQSAAKSLHFFAKWRQPLRLRTRCWSITGVFQYEPHRNLDRLARRRTRS